LSTPESAAAKTAESSSTKSTKAAKAAALKALETLARKVITRPILSLAVQITESASTTGPRLSWHAVDAVGNRTLGQYAGVCLALKARRSITAWGNAPGVWSSAESAIQCGRPFVPSMERCKTHQIETRFQRLFGRQSQFLGRYPRLK